jgi:hypothetical protein
MRRFNDREGVGGQSRYLMLATILLIVGCASSRHYELVGRSQSLTTTKTFYVVVSGATERVDYNYLGGALIPGYALDYERYAKGRVRGEVKLDVPVEIVKYLKERGKDVALGPADLAPQGDAVIISYDELWGWDMGDIIKALTIRARPSGVSTEETSVKFEEMTIFNTHPVASSVVPAMMNVLFPSTNNAQAADRDGSPN